MEKSFDLGSLLQKHKKNHKSKPMQFESIAGGVQRRLTNCLKQRKSTRLTSFDQVRNLPQASPEPVREDTQKNPDQRRLQLEKWKLEKEAKKKLLAAEKKKPFIASAVQPYNPLKYIPPPPLKPLPSTSGCVTRSQTARMRKVERKQPQYQSFAPQNAKFQAPKINTLAKLPQLAPLKRSVVNVASYTFNPVVLSTSKPAAMQTRSKAYIKIAAESRLKRNAARDLAAISHTTKSISKNRNPEMVQISTSSEDEPVCMQTSSSSSAADLTVKMVSSSSSEHSDINTKNHSTKSKMVNKSTSSRNKQFQMQTSSSNSIVDLTKMVSTSCEAAANSSIETNSLSSGKSLQSSSSIELESNKKTRLRISTSVRNSTSNQLRTPNKATKAPKQDGNNTNIPKIPVHRSESSSEEKPRSAKLSSSTSKRLRTPNKATKAPKQDENNTNIPKIPVHRSESSSEEKPRSPKLSSSTSKRLRTPNKATKAPKQDENNTNIPKIPVHRSKSSSEEKPRSPKLSSSTSKRLRTPNKATKAPKQDENNTNTPKNPVPRSESSSEEKLRSPKLSSSDIPMTPEQASDEFKKISPCVTLSRGKENARKEMKKKIELGLFESEKSHMEDLSHVEDVEHFQRQHASEIRRLTEICEEWDAVYEQVALPESAQELVLGAVGQARLLMTQKMQQFASLIQRCVRPEPGSPLVTAADLSGFWDMVYMQVENVNMRFKKLEELKARNWVEEAAPAPRRVRAAPAPGPRRVRAAPPSKLRDVIAAARRAKTQVAEPAAPEQHEQRTFEAGFFSVRSPARPAPAPAPAPARSSPAPAPAPRTPRHDTSLLKVVLSSEAKKASTSKKSASFAMLRASLLGRSIECEGVFPLPQTPLPNLNATPGRSILKQSHDQSGKKPHKQIRMVLFDQSLDSDHEPPTAEASTLKKIDASKDAKETSDTTEATAKTTFEELSGTDDGKEHAEEKENRYKSVSLTRQNALLSSETIEVTPQNRIMTRKQKTLLTLQPEPDTPAEDGNKPRSERRRSNRKKVLEEVANNVEEEKTPRRSRRRTTMAER